VVPADIPLTDAAAVVSLSLVVIVKNEKLALDLQTAFLGLSLLFAAFHQDTMKME
jgi:hypothetical protein